MQQKVSQSTSLVKITRPQPEQVLARTRLLQRLDRARKIIWVVAPPGAGKTTLVADHIGRRKRACLWYQIDEDDADIAAFFHYLGLAVKKAAPRKRRPLPHLTPEYRAGLATFTRRYFQELYSRLKPPFTLVFDNYQEVAADAGLHEVLRDGLDGLPAGGHVVVLSRSTPPPVFARFLASGAMEILDWDALKLTLEEFSSVARLRGQDKLPAEMLQQLYARTQGWAAGLVLMLERTEDSRPQAALDSTPEAIFDYFAGEVFDKSDDKTREVLLQTAFLPMLGIKTVEKLTGQHAAARILSDLSRKSYFTVKHPQAEPVYQYHPLFQEFLRARAKELLAPERLAALQQNAAALLEADGQVEAAADLLQAARDWAMLARLIGRHAQLFVSQGRMQTIEGWLRGVPEDVRARDPWLEYWLGVCRLPFAPTEAREHFARAYERFKSGGDLPGVCLAWGAVIDTFVYEWQDFKPMEPWIARLEELPPDVSALPPPLAEHLTSAIFIALVHGRPAHPDLVSWAERVARIVRESKNLSLRIKVAPHLLQYYTWWSGELPKAELFLNTLRAIAAAPGVPPLVQITWQAMSSAYHWVIAENDACAEAANRGLEVADASGVHVWDFLLCSQGIFAAVFGDKPAPAEPYFARMRASLNPARRVDAAWYYYLLAGKCFLEGDFARALDHSEQCVRLNEEAGVALTGAYGRADHARVMFYSGDRERAVSTMRETRSVGKNMRCAGIEYVTYLTEAEFALLMNDTASCIEGLRHALPIARRHGFQTRTWWHPGIMSRLYAVALEHEIEADYVRSLIRKRRLLPPEGGATESWPYPVKIHALGRFDILRDGAPLKFSGKVQRKPLDLLQVLIALGGRDVPEAHLSDILWPDAAGDDAHRAFLTTLQRLRRVLGYKDALVSADGRLTLDPRYAWVDVSAFERLLNQAETAEHERRGEAACDLRIKALGLYRGHFSGQETAPAVSLRERLRDKYLRHSEALGRYWEQIGNWARALECYLKALEVDALAEVFYQRLMAAYQKLDRRAEALAVYERCSKTLAAALGIKPSAATQALYRGLTGR